MGFFGFLKKQAEDELVAPNMPPSLQDASPGPAPPDPFGQVEPGAMPPSEPDIPSMEAPPQAPDKLGELRDVPLPPPRTPDPTGEVIEPITTSSEPPINWTDDDIPDFSEAEIEAAEHEESEVQSKVPEERPAEAHATDEAQEHWDKDDTQPAAPKEAEKQEEAPAAPPEALPKHEDFPRHEAPSYHLPKLGELPPPSMVLPERYIHGEAYSAAIASVFGLKSNAKEGEVIMNELAHMINARKDDLADFADGLNTIQGELLRMDEALER